MHLLHFGQHRLQPWTVASLRRLLGLRLRVRALLAFVAEEQLVSLRELLLELGDLQLQLLGIAPAQRVQLLLQLPDQPDELLVVLLQQQRRLAQEFDVFDLLQGHVVVYVTPDQKNRQPCVDFFPGQRGVRSLSVSSGGLSSTRPMASLPSMKSCSSLGVICSTPSFARSYTAAKRPLSNLFASKQRPVPSKKSTFARLRSRLTKRKKRPLSTSRPSPTTSADSVLKLLRMSTGSPKAYTAI